MRDASNILKDCRQLGATVIPVNDRLRIQAPAPLPHALIEELQKSKRQILAELSRELHHEHQCWILEEWRRISIPDWRRILHESIDKGDHERADYARWMLREMLNDEEYAKEADT